MSYSKSSKFTLMLADICDAYAPLLAIITSFLHLRSLPKQSHALHWHPSMDPRHLLQCQQSLFPAPNPWRVSRPGVQLQQLNVSWFACTNSEYELVLHRSDTCTHPSLFRLARFWVDAQELLFEDTEFLQLGRLWRELVTMSNFMDTLRTNPDLIAGQQTSVSQPFLHCLHQALRLHHMFNLPWRGPFMGNAKKLMFLPCYYF